MFLPKKGHENFYEAKRVKKKKKKLLKNFTNHGVVEMYIYGFIVDTKLTSFCNNILFWFIKESTVDTFGK